MPLDVIAAAVYLLIAPAVVLALLWWALRGQE